MPSVASEATTPAIKPPLTNPARPAQSSEGGQPSPFDALLDAGTEAAAQPAPPPPPATAQTAPADSSQPPAKSQDKSQTKDGDAAKTTNTDTTANTASAANSDPTATGGNAVSSVKAKTDAKSCEQTGDDTKLTGDKTAGDGKPADGLTSAAHTALLANNAAQAVVPATALVTAAAAVAVPQAVSATDLQSAVTAMENSKGKPAINSDASTKTTSALKGDGKPQPATGDADKLATAPTHDEAPSTNGHHIATAEVPPTITADAQATAPKTFADAVQQAALTAPSQDVTQTAANPAAPAPPAAQALAVPQAISATALQGAVTAMENSKGKQAINSDASTKTTSALKGDGKPQPATGDADKLATAPTHDEAPATNGHHIATAEVPPAITADAQTTTPKTFSDAVQQAALTAPLQDVTQAAANPAAPAPPAAQALTVPLAGVAIEIAGKALEGKNRFEIRLDPPELGRIEVRLDVDRDGNAVTRLIADRSDTLDLLRRDANNLQQALQDAGLKTSDNGLQFSLRDQTMGRDQSNTPMPAAAQIVVKDDALPTDISPRNYPRLAGLGGGIDIRV